MFGIPQGPQTHLEGETFQGCQVVYMYDIPAELSTFINALYDGPNFDTLDFFYTAGILRLATKYFVGRLRLQAIQHLAQTWSYTLKGHDEMVHTALVSPLINDFTYPYVHPLHVLNLAREVNAGILIPSALYFLSLYPLADILAGNHPKLLTNRPSKPSSVLSLDDIPLYTLMFQYRIQVILDFVRRFCGDKVTSPKCGNVSSCGPRFSRLVSQLNRSWSMRTGPLHYMLQAIQQVSHDFTICDTCRKEFSEDASVLREEVWCKLPTIISSPDWAAMEIELSSN